MLGGSKAKIKKAVLNDATNKFLPVNRQIEESRTMFRWLTPIEGVEGSKKVTQNFVRCDSFEEIEALLGKYGWRFRLKKSRFIEIPFEIYIKRNWFW